MLGDTCVVLDTVLVAGADIVDHDSLHVAADEGVVSVSDSAVSVSLEAIVFCGGGDMF